VTGAGHPSMLKRCWAPEYVEAMWLMLQQEQPKDLILSTGHLYTLEDFVKLSFETLDLDYKDYLEVSDAFIRPNDISCSAGSPALAKQVLNWQAQSTLPEITKMMVNAEQHSNNKSS